MQKPSKNWPRNNTSLTIERFKIVYEQYREVFKDLGQPYIPFDQLSQESKNKFESALSAANFQSSNGEYRFAPGSSAAAAYLFFITKSHALFNGNKRASLAAVFGYLTLNGKYLSTKWSDLYEIARLVTESPRGKLNETIRITSNFIEQFLVDFDEQLVKEIQISISDYSQSSTEGNNKV